MNIEKYTDRARGFVQSAQSLALREGHQQFTPEHLLKVLIDDEEGLAARLINAAVSSNGSGGRDAAVRNGVSVRLAIPLNHGAFPRNAAQLKELGVGYTNCAPTPEARLLKSLSDQAAEQRKLLG